MLLVVVSGEHLLAEHGQDSDELLQASSYEVTQPDPPVRVGDTSQADESLPGQRERQSILGSDLAGGAKTILAVDTGMRGHRVDLLGHERELTSEDHAVAALHIDATPYRAGHIPLCWTPLRLQAWASAEREAAGNQVSDGSASVTSGDDLQIVCDC